MSAFQIEHVEQNSPADKAGLKLGDVITSVNGEKLDTVEQVTESGKKNTAYDLEVISNGQRRSVVIYNERLGCELIPTSTQQPSSSAPINTHIESSYKVNLILCKITAFIGWLFFSGGILIALLMIADGQIGEALFFAIGSITGLLIVQVSQISKAITDTADYTRATFLMNARKINSDRQ